MRGLRWWLWHDYHGLRLITGDLVVNGSICVMIWFVAGKRTLAFGALLVSAYVLGTLVYAVYCYYLDRNGPCGCEPEIGRGGPVRGARGGA